MSSRKRARGQGFIGHIRNAASAAASSPSVRRIVQTSLRQAFRSVGTSTGTQTTGRSRGRVSYGVGTHLYPGMSRGRFSSRRRALSSVRRRRPYRRSGVASRRGVLNYRRPTLRGRVGTSRPRRFVRRAVRRSVGRVSRSAVLRAMAPPLVQRTARGNSVTSGVVMIEGVPMALHGAGSTYASVGKYGYASWMHHDPAGIPVRYNSSIASWSGLLPTPADALNESGTDRTYFQGMYVSPRILRIEMANTSGSATVTDVFVVTPRRDLSKEGTNNVTHPLIYANSAWQHMVAYGTASTAADRIDLMDVGIDFWKAPGFNRYFRCRRAASVRLSHGQTTFLRVRVRGYKWVNTDRQTDGPYSNLAADARASTWVIYRLKGQAGAVAAIGGGSFPSASYTAASTHTVVNFTTRYSPIPYMRPLFNVNAEVSQAQLTRDEYGELGNQVVIANEFGQGDVVVPPLLSGVDIPT